MMIPFRDAYLLGSNLMKQWAEHLFQRNIRESIP